MKAKKEWFKSRTGWACDGGHWWTAAGDRDPRDTHRVRVTDARELTAEKAVQKVLQSLKLSKWDIELTDDEIIYHAARAGMAATVINGKVTVRKIKGEKQ